MKTINKFMLGIALVGALPMMTACSDDNGNEVVEPTPVEDPTFEILSELPDPPTFSFTAAGNKAQTLAFNTNQNWKIELVNTQEDDNYEWLTLFDRQGTGSENTQRVWIATGKNTEYDARRAEFTLTVGEGEDAQIKTFWVYQAQLDAVLATDPKAFMNLSNREQVLPLDFQYNVEEYEISVSDKSWMTVMDEAPSKSRALVSETKYVKIADNDKFDVRTGTITIKDKNNSSTSVTIPVSQYGLAKPIILVNNASEFASLSAAEATIDLNLSTENVVSVCDQLTIDIPEAAKDWLSFEPNADNTGYVVKVKENKGGARTAKIAVAAKADHNIKNEITVKQSSAAGVAVSITNKSAFESYLDKMGGSCSVKYQTETEDWDCALEGLDGEPVDWVKIANKKMPGQILLSYDANPALKLRTAVLKVFPAGNKDKADYVTLIQNPGTQVIVSGTLQQTLDQLVADGIYKSVKDITSLELKGELSRTDYNLLQNMLKGKVGNETGYKLNTIDLSEVTTDKITANQFNGCTQLKKIIFPKALRSMEEKICANCTNLTSAKFPEGVTYIANHTFQNCSSLQEAWIPSTVQYIYGMVFEKCNKLKALHFQTLPLQYRQVARSATQPTTASDGIFDEALRKQLGTNLTLYVPGDYEKYWRAPDPQHVVNSHLADYLKNLTADSKEWTTATAAFLWKPGSAYSLKVDFTWSFTAIVAEDSWE